VVGPRPRVTLCLREVGIPGGLKMTSQTGEEVRFPLPLFLYDFVGKKWQFPPLLSLFEWDGERLEPSEATLDQWVDGMPTRELRALHRGRLCLECAFAVDLCSCGCCPEARR